MEPNPLSFRVGVCVCALLFYRRWDSRVVQRLPKRLSQWTFIRGGVQENLRQLLPLRWRQQGKQNFLGMRLVVSLTDHQMKLISAPHISHLPPSFRPSCINHWGNMCTNVFHFPSPVGFLLWHIFINVVLVLLWRTETRTTDSQCLYYPGAWKLNLLTVNKILGG